MEKDIIDDSLDLDNDELDDPLDMDDGSFNGGFDDFGMDGDQTPMSKYSDLLKELTNFDPIIQRRIRNWLGLEWDENVKDYKQKKSAIINEKGARWVIGCLETYQAKTNIITNLAREEYLSIKLEIVDLAWLIFPTKFDEFDIKDTADQWRLSNELQHSAFLVLAGAGDGKYTKFLGETHTVHENINMQPDNNNNPNRNGGNDFWGNFKINVREELEWI